MDVFREKRRAGKTIVLVTHDMTTVQTLCHRAMLLHDGELRYIGEPEDAALSYYRMNFARPGGPTANGSGRRGQARRRQRAGGRRRSLRGAAGATGRDARGGRADRARRRAGGGAPAARPIFIFHVRNDEGQTVFELSRRLDAEVAAGRRVALAGPVENRLVPGRYSLDSTSARTRRRTA